MEPEGSLPNSQVPATYPYPEPARSSPNLTSYFLKIQLNIIFPSKPGSPQWSPSLGFPHQNPVHNSPLPHTGYMPRPSYSSTFLALFLENHCALYQCYNQTANKLNKDSYHLSTRKGANKIHRLKTQLMHFVQIALMVISAFLLGSRVICAYNCTALCVRSECTRFWVFSTKWPHVIHEILVISCEYPFITQVPIFW